MCPFQIIFFLADRYEMGYWDNHEKWHGINTPDGYDICNNYIVAIFSILRIAGIAEFLRSNAFIICHESIEKGCCPTPSFLI